MKNSPSPVRAEAGVVLAFGALALVITWPLALNLGSQVVGTPSVPDYIGHLWHCKWFATALFDGVSPYQVHTLLYPVGSTDLVIKSGPCLNAAMTVPFQAVLGAVASHNLVVLGLMVLTAYAGYRLVLDLTGDRASSFAAGAVLTMNPLMYSEMSVGHMDQFSGGWCLLTLLCVLRTVRGQGRFAPVLAGLFFALSTLSYLGFGLLLGMLLPLLVVWLLAADRALLGWPLVRRLAVAGVTATVLLSPVLAAYMTQEGSGESSGATAVAFSLLDAPDRVDTLPMTERIIVTESIRPLQLRLMYREGERGLLPQVHVLVLLLVATGLVLRRRQALPWAVLALLFGVLAMGPYLRGNAPEPATSALAPLPGLLLYNHAPFFTRFRFPYRFMFMVWICLVPVVGLGIHALMTRVGLAGRQRLGVAAALCLLLFIESTSRGLLPFPAPLERFPRTPSFYTEVLAQGPPGAIVNVPFALDKPSMEEERAFPVPFWQSLEMHYHAQHGRPILTGHWVAFSPPPIHRRFVQSNTLLSSIMAWQQDRPGSAIELADLRALEDLGFRYVVFNEDWVRPHTAAAIRHRLAQLFGPPGYESGDPLAVYEIAGKGPARQDRQEWETVALRPLQGPAPPIPADPRYQPAVAELADRVEADPADLAARLELVDRLEEAGAFGLALATLDAGGDDARIHHRRGRLLHDRGIPLLALDAYERALELDPSLSIDLESLQYPAVTRGGIVEQANASGK